MMNKQSLIDQIKTANAAYSLGKPFLIDFEYDALWQQLHVIEPEHPCLYHTARDPNLAANQRPHKYQIMGTQKAFDTTELLPFLTRFSQSRLILQPKYDGCAAILSKQPCNSFSLVLEGNGIAGRDISHLLPNMILTFHPYEINSVELIIPLDKWTNDLGKNPRNTVAGWLASIKGPPDNMIDIISHSYGKLWQIMHPPHDISTIEFELLRLYSIWNKIYPMDGMMIKLADQSERLLVGDNGTTYNWSIAWKPPIQTKETIVRSIEWNVSRSGRVIPTVIYDPIELCGTTNTRVTGNNAEWITSKKVSEDCTIIVGKAGEIIPKIITVQPNDKQPNIPEICPVCSSRLIWVGRDLICQSSDCMPQVARTVAYFYSDKGMDLKSIGEKRIWELLEASRPVRELLSEAPWALLDYSRYIDLYETAIKTWGRQRFSIFHENLQEISNKRTQIDFIAALGLPGLARKTVIKLYNFMKTGKMKSNISEKSKTSFIKAFATFKQAEKELSGFKFKEVSEPAKFIYCITGKLSYSRADMIDYLAKYQWEFSNQVSKFTDILILGETSRTTTKLEKAKTLGIKIIEENDLLDLLIDNNTNKIKE